MQIVDGIPYMNDVKKLIIEYTNRLGKNLSFQHLDEELKNPEKKYGSPNGDIIVALDNDQKVLGMVAYHRLSENRCEMKRLYITPAGRGKHTGNQLVTEIMKRAKDAGYKEMVLDTLSHLQAARHIYESNGFEPCEAYYDNPLDEVIYMKKVL